ncbi:hypothetical protein PCK1_003195 [Pneumocystis canis]|nr:hypothetical protein PCK1_003195 [Pneumocystis canis]
MELGEAIAQYSPNAFILVISNPINSTVPIMAEVLKAYNVFNPKKRFGVTTLDKVRLSTFITQCLGADEKLRDLDIPVVGGHSEKTIIPLISNSNPKVELTQEQLETLIHRVQYAGDEVVKAKNGAGSATLSMALYAKSGVSNIVQCSYVYLPGISGGDQVMKITDHLEFFTVPVKLGVSGLFD